MTVTLTASGRDLGRRHHLITASTAQPRSRTPHRSRSPPSGRTPLSYYSVDQAGNAETPKTLTFTIANPLPPTTVATPTGPNGTGGWYTGPVSVTLAATDPNYPSSALTTTYSLDSGKSQTYTAGQSIAIKGDGTHTLTYQSKDPAGRTETIKTLTVPIDATPPTTTATLSGQTGSGGVYITPVTVTLTATDTTSGIATTSYSLDGAAAQPYTGPFTVTSAGSHTVSYYSVDQAGNREAAHSLSFQIAQQVPFNNSIDILVLNPSGTRGVECVRQWEPSSTTEARSPSTRAMPPAGSSRAMAVVSASQILDAGGITTSGKASLSGTVVHQLPTADPLAGLAAPSVPSQTFAAVNYTGKSNLTLSPGTYVGGIKLNGSGTVTLKPGIYYMQGGGFSVGGTGTVMGLGVLIYNAPGNPGDAINLNGKGVVVLTPETSGPYQGITIFQARTSNVPIQIGGQETLAMTGTHLCTGRRAEHLRPGPPLRPGRSVRFHSRRRSSPAGLNVSDNGVLNINPFGSASISPEPRRRPRELVLQR